MTPSAPYDVYYDEVLPVPAQVAVAFRTRVTWTLGPAEIVHSDALDIRCAGSVTRSCKEVESTAQCSLLARSPGRIRPCLHNLEDH